MPHRQQGRRHRRRQVRHRHRHRTRSCSDEGWWSPARPASSAPTRHGLNARGIDDIVAVDDLTRRRQVPQPGRVRIADYFDKDEFYDLFARATSARSRWCSTRARAPTRWSTTGKLHDGQQLPLLLGPVRRLPGARHAPALRVVGRGLRRLGTVFREEPEYERPLNVYGYSKLLFDQVVRRDAAGLRPRRWRAALLQRLRPARAAQGPHGVRWRSTSSTSPRRGQGQAVRRVRRLRRRASSGATSSSSTTWSRSTCGSRAPGQSRHLQRRHRPRAAVQRRRARRRQRPARRGRPSRATLAAQVEQRLVEYVEFPDALVGKYQCYTQADLTALRAAGCDCASSTWPPASRATWAGCQLRASRHRRSARDRARPSRRGGAEPSGATRQHQPRRRRGRPGCPRACRRTAASARVDASSAMRAQDHARAGLAAVAVRR